MTSKPVSLPRESYDNYAKPQRREWAAKLERLINSSEHDKALWRKIAGFYGDPLFILDDLYSGLRPQIPGDNDLRSLISDLEKVASGLARHRHLLPEADVSFPDTAARIAEHFKPMARTKHKDSHCERFFLLISDLAIDPWSGPFKAATKDRDAPKPTTIQDCIDLITLGVRAMNYNGNAPKVPQDACMRGYIKRLRRLSSK